MATSGTRRCFWLSTAVFLLGCLVEYYAQALGAFIVHDCTYLGASAVGRCAWPYRLAISGIVLTFAGISGWCWPLLRAVFRKRPAP